ncbi:MAG TPA: hypothetical protein PK313_01270, partial [Myxococcota bacterium]|nr:hypothetical protein [Myxococcota bacterium]
MNRRPTWLAAIGWNLALVAVCAAAWIVLGALLLFTLTMWRFFDAQREDRSHDRFLHQVDNA